MKKIIWPAAITLASFLAYFALRSWLSGPLHAVGFRDLLAFCYVLLGMTIVRWSSYLFFDLLYLKRTGREAPGLLKVMFSLVCYSILFMLILGLVLKYDVTGLVATSAAVSVVIGFALQDTLGNFFAGASLHIEQPFKIKDSIRFRDRTGEVETVSWRSTAIRTTDNSLLITPNSLLAREPIEVFPYDSLHRHSVSFSAPYSVAPQTVIDVARSAALDLPDVTYEVQPTARITGFGESCVDYELLYWLKDYMRANDASARLRERLWYAFHRERISMPFPTRHVLLENINPEDLEYKTGVDYRRAIDGIDIFQPLTSVEKDALLTLSHVLLFAPGEYMVRCGQPGDSMFIIGRGEAEVCVSSNGTHSTVAVLKTGGFFGEMSLFSGEPRSADVIAIEESEVLEIGKTGIEKLLLENASLARTFSKTVSERLAVLEEHAGRVCRREEIKVEEGKFFERIKRIFNLG
ncbi:MAG: mechanosensitive ion channel family protein [Syntrophobacteraceae bacterium]|nr:mechanosensitive ion channel family protein [Syntrophobacteraceae bacterium]